MPTYLHCISFFLEWHHASKNFKKTLKTARKAQKFYFLSSRMIFLFLDILTQLRFLIDNLNSLGERNIFNGNDYLITLSCFLEVFKSTKAFHLKECAFLS